MRDPDAGLLDWVLLAVLVSLWGTSFLLTDLAVRHVAPAHVVTLRLVLAAVLLSVLALAMRRRWSLRPQVLLWAALLSACGNVLPFFLISWGQQFIDSGLAGVLMGIMPLATLLLAHFFVPGERLRRHRLIGFVFGFIGIVLLVGPDALLGLGAGGQALLGQLAVLAGALSYAVNAVLARRRPVADLWTLSCLVLFAGSLMSLPLSSLQPLPIAVPASAWIAVSLLGVLSTGVATLVYFTLVTRAGPTFLSTINYLIPPWALLLGAVFLDERPGPGQIAAMLCILGGIALARPRPGRPPSRAGAGSAPAPDRD